ncbi:MAG: cobalamin-independent methionine synthase II family protein [Acidiferrobacterales bacterium]
MITARTDVIGSLLRPPALLSAQQQLAVGAISPAQFKAIEDQAVDEAVALQEQAGLDVVTDGEMRRLSFQSQMTAAVDGFGEHDLDAFLWGDWFGDADVGYWHKTRPTRLGVVHQLSRKRHLSAEEFTYLRSCTTRIPKITLPSPTLWTNFWSAEHSIDAYPSLEGFLADVVDILRGEVEELARLGATYIQIDAPHYTLLLDPKTRAFYEQQGWSLDRWLDRGIELDNALMTGFPNVTFGFHLCRGNQDSRWLVEGGYDLIAQPIFGRIRAQRLLLEYDDVRSGSFGALDAIPDDKFVVLGLVSTKQSRLEPQEKLIARIRDAAQHVSLDRLAISPQCGFSTSIIGNRISLEDQRNKLSLIAKTAGDVWG